jgi:hypothetical protein
MKKYYSAPGGPRKGNRVEGKGSVSALRTEGRKEIGIKE